MKASTAQIQYIRATLLAGLPTIRKSRSRAMLREAVMRIRQLGGVLEARKGARK